MSAITTYTIVILCLLAFISCDNKSKTELLFIVPNDYRGPIRVVESANDGIQPKKEGTPYILRVPASGEIRIRTLEILESWHRRSAREENGVAIPSAEEIAPGSVGFHGLGTAVEGETTTSFYFVGTRQEAEQFAKSVHLR